MTIQHTQDLAQIRAMVPEMRRVKCIHFIGIGGAGMSGIAEVLLTKVMKSRVQTCLKTQ